MSVVSIPIIVIITYSVMEVFKYFVFKKDQKYYKFIPLMSGALGLILGIIGFYAFPGWLLPSNLLHAILVGTFSGLSATGTNQIIKQFRKQTIVKEIEKNLFTDNPPVDADSQNDNNKADFNSNIKNDNSTTKQ